MKQEKIHTATRRSGGGVPKGLLWVGRGFIPCFGGVFVSVPKGPLCTMGWHKPAERSLRDAVDLPNGIRALKRPANETGPFGTVGLGGGYLRGRKLAFARAAGLLLALLAVGNICAQEESDAWKKIAPYFSPPAEFVDDFGDYQTPMLFPDEDGHIATQPEQWQRRRADIRYEWMKMMGEWPALMEDQQLEVFESEEREDFVQHRVRFRWLPEPAEPTEGYLLVPGNLKEGQKLPAVITVYYEPETAAGMGRENRDFAYQLVKRGFVTLSIGTTKTSEAKTYALHWPSLDDAKVEPLSMLAYAAANAWHALANRPEVDADRIGIVGHSYGGKWAMFASCLFDKFAAAAWSDPGIVFDDTRPSINYWEPWYLGWHPRPWRKRGMVTEENPARGLYPKLREKGRDLHELHALMAPRPFLVSGGAEDPPKRWQALNHSVAVNALLGFENRVAMTNRPEHAPNPESNAVIYAFFEWFLQPAGE